MKIIYNKNDVATAIKTHLMSQGFDLEGKVVKTERVKDLIHVSIDDEGSILEEEESDKDSGFMEDE